MSVIIEELLEALMFVGLPASMFIFSIYQLFWKNKIRLFVVTNLILSALFVITGLLNLGGGHPPMPALALVLILFILVPIHVIVSSCCIALKYFLDNKLRLKKSKKTEQANGDVGQ